MIHLRVTPSTVGAGRSGAGRQRAAQRRRRRVSDGDVLRARRRSAIGRRGEEDLRSSSAAAPDQPLPLIASDIDQVVDHVGTMTPLAARLASRGWPGPLTLIIPASPHLCDDVHLSTGKVAVRVPADAVARALARSAGHAITSTSANISGDPPAATPEQVVASFGERHRRADRLGSHAGGLPSTIVDATGRRSSARASGRDSVGARARIFEINGILNLPAKAPTGATAGPRTRRARRSGASAIEKAGCGALDRRARRASPKPPARPSS